MKKLMLWALCLLIAVPMFAEGGLPFSTKGLRHAEATVVDGGNVSFADMRDEFVRATRRGPGYPSTNVVLEGSESIFVFPIMGSAAGGGGTFWRSETVIINRLNRTQNVRLFYFPVGGGSSNCTRGSQVLQIPAQSWVVYTDFVASPLNAPGTLGALVAMAIPSASSNTLDTTASIDGNSRIWTMIPGTTGTASQNFPSVSLQMPAGGQSSFGLRHDEFYRTNWGVFNYDTVAHDFTVFINGARGSNLFSQRIDACSLIMPLVPGGPYGSFELYIERAGGGGDFFSFGSSVDNTSGDSWSVIGRSF